MMKKTSVLPILAAFMLAACAGMPQAAGSGAETPPGSETPQTPASGPAGAEPDAGYAETRPEASSRDELTVAFSAADVELDFRKSYLASEAQIFTALYEGLFSYHPLTMEPVPALAEKWELSKDKKTWTFTLRENARFSNGDKLKASDFRAAWLSLLEPKRNSPYSSLFDIIEGAREYRSGAEAGAAKVGIECPDDRTLVVRLNAPASFFAAMLCHHSFSPIHQSLVNTDRWTRDNLVSNGPFTLESVDTEKMKLAKNGRYWDAAQVALNSITIRFSENAEKAASMWNSGEARWIAGDVDIDRLTDLSGIQVNPMFATHYYFFRSADKPWNDYRVRRALVAALPWDKIREGLWMPAETLIYPLPGYPELTGFTQGDTAEGKRLLAQAGYPDGEGLPELVLRLTPSPDAQRIGGLMAQTWKEQLGVPVRVEVIPYGAYFDSLKDGNYEVASSTWIGDFADPYTFLQMWRRDSNLNDACLDDPDYEKLIDRSMTEEGDTRLKTLGEAEQLLLDRGSVLPISYSPAINIINMSEIDGWYPNPLDVHPFRYLQFKAYRPLPNVAAAK